MKTENNGLWIILQNPQEVKGCWSYKGRGTDRPPEPFWTSDYSVTVSADERRNITAAVLPTSNYQYLGPFKMPRSPAPDSTSCLGDKGALPTGKDLEKYLQGLSCPVAFVLADPPALPLVKKLGTQQTRRWPLLLHANWCVVCSCALRRRTEPREFRVLLLQRWSARRSLCAS